MRQRLKRCWFIGTVVLIALPPFAASATEPVRSVDIVEASAFLEGYRAASEAHSVDFYDLYSDRAVVHVRIQDHERGVAFQGRAFKAWGRQLLTEGRSAPDSSIFHEATVEQRGTRLLIRAKRYSTAKCYWDLSYQVGIEREGTSFRIVDERLTTQPTASCRSAGAVDQCLGEHRVGDTVRIHGSTDEWRRPCRLIPRAWHRGILCLSKNSRTKRCNSRSSWRPRVRRSPTQPV